ncbi:hypothetical protein IWX81_001370 [Salinibacterium sp. CAN_S4]|uniref:hypothetical protein n=1 Tax=Salinibacterium sp. CAN_S4 TaxID=2787727 RepID=UPI0018EF9430
MSSSNRFLNRLLLVVVGLALIGMGGWLLVAAYPQVLSVVPGLPETLPAVPETTVPVLWIAAVVTAVLAFLCLPWVFTRGRGRISYLLQEEGAAGSVSFDNAVASQLLDDALGTQPDVISVKVTSHRVRRRPALAIALTARNGSDLPRLLSAVTDAVEQLDAVVEQRIPVLLHVTSGVRASFAREQRVT